MHCQWIHTESIEKPPPLCLNQICFVLVLWKSVANFLAALAMCRGVSWAISMSLITSRFIYLEWFVNAKFIAAKHKAARMIWQIWFQDTHPDQVRVEIQPKKNAQHRLKKHSINHHIKTRRLCWFSLSYVCLTRLVWHLHPLYAFICHVPVT